MSTISGTAARRETAAGGIIQAVWSAVTRWWVAYTAWRIEQAAVARLGSMNDRELRDIGLSRSEIERAVRGDRERDRVLSRRL
jgi:uncharacterized protein YjiS (DUF1127 family)